jgi:Holliday junction resolvasome RuvABC endonuclease subunit
MTPERLPPTVLGVDIGFAATGLVVVDPRTLRVLFAHTYRSSASNRKRGVRVADADTERCQQLARFLWQTLTDDQHRIGGVVVELPTGGAKNARSARAMGLATGVIATVLEYWGGPVEWVTPQQVKEVPRSLGYGTSKADVEAAVRGLLSWGDHMPKTAADREHVCDAAAAIISARDGLVFRLLRQVTNHRDSVTIALRQHGMEVSTH